VEATLKKSLTLLFSALTVLLSGCTTAQREGLAGWDIPKPAPQTYCNRIGDQMFCRTY
jgi:starvation-inducible outer membrane lipoprotein